nr:hypothetical protein [Tanacetum cinerariifolium]
MESDEFIKSSVKNLIPIPSESEGIPEHSNNEVSSIDDDSFFIDIIDYVEASPPDSELVSSEVMEIVILEFDLGEISSGSTTTHSDISLPDYEAFSFDDDHIKGINGGSTTTRSDLSLSEYDSFTFDLSNDQCPPTDRSNLTHEEFIDELAHIISPPEYDCLYFRDLPDPDELMSILNSEIRENLSTTCVNLPIEDDHSPLLAYVVWIFLAYLTIPGNLKTLAKRFYLPSLYFLSFNWESCIQFLSTNVYLLAYLINGLRFT